MPASEMSIVIFNHATFTITLLIAFLLDFLLADPVGFPHPVVLMGKLIALLDRWLNRPLLDDRQRLIRGAFVALLLPALAVLFLQILLNSFYSINPWVYFVIRVFLVYQLLALKGLADAANNVAHALRHEGLEAARYQLSHVVGRETRELSAVEVVKATVETVAENFSDGVFAPMFFFLLFDLPGLFFYKIINTLDSMIAYRNARYEYFGKTAAKLDDVVNFIPARLAALIMFMGTSFTGLDSQSAWQVFVHDRNRHTSPNAGQTEAVAAGALGLQLGGMHIYHGVEVEKPTLGQDTHVADIADIDQCVHLLYTSAGLGVLFVVAVKYLIRII